MPLVQILKGSYGTSLSLVAAAIVSCIILGAFVWTTERAASEARLLAEVQQQESMFLELIESGTATATRLLQFSEVRALFAGYREQATQPDASYDPLHAVLDAWLRSSSTFSGVAVLAADGRILGQAGISPALAHDFTVASARAPPDKAILHPLPRTGQLALVVPVKDGTRRTVGTMTLLLSESAVSLPTQEHDSRWQSTRYSLAARKSDRGLQFVRPAFERNGAVEREMRARNLQKPGLWHLNEVVIAWSGMRADAAGVLGQVDADEFSGTATGTALLVTSGAAAVFLLAGLLVMLRSRQLARRLGQDLLQLRGELASQMREEQGLLATTAQMSTAARLAAIGHWVTQRTNSRWMWTAATPEVARIYGVPRRRLIGGLGFSRQLVHPEDQARMHAIWDEVNRNPRRYEAEFRIIQPSGDVRHVVEVGEPVFDQFGVLTNFHGTMQDITDHRHSESVVSEAEARLRQPPTSATVCHWVSYENPDDVSDSRYTYSSSAVNLFGTPPEQLPLCPGDMERFIHPDDVARVMEQYRQSGLSPAPYSICYRLLRPDGSVLWVEETSEPAFAPGGGITHTFGTMTEIPAPPGAQ